MNASDIDFDYAFRLFNSSGGEVINCRDTANLLSLFTSLSDEDFRDEYGNTQFTDLEAQNVLQKLKQNSQNRDKLTSLLNELNKNEYISKNTLFHIFKSFNKISARDFEEFLDHLNMNHDKIPVNQLVDKLSNFY